VLDREIAGHNVCYEWSLSRSHERVTGHLQGFEGVLQSDAYEAYLRLAEGSEAVTVAACWAHARRKFFDAKDYHKRECGIYLKLVSRLYAVEAEIRARRAADPDGFGDAEALELRRAKSANTVARIARLLRILKARALPRSPLGKACDYSLRIWPHLLTYLERGDVHIDNNAMENAIRPTAIGKKNWLFVGHPKAGDRPAVTQARMRTSAARINRARFEATQTISGWC